MSFKTATPRRAVLISAAIFAAALACAPFSSHESHAQAPRPVLVSEATTTRAVSWDSVAHTREPFALTSPHSLAADRRTRVQIFALNLTDADDPSSLKAEAEDGAHKVYALAVESVAPVPGQEWMRSITLRLDDSMADVGDVLVRVTARGVASNRVRVGIGHVGGGP